VLPKALYRILRTAASSWKPATNVSGKAICKKANAVETNLWTLSAISLQQFKKLACFYEICITVFTQTPALHPGLGYCSEENILINPITL
jgi:hypothetical protein